MKSTHFTILEGSYWPIFAHCAEEKLKTHELSANKLCIIRKKMCIYIYVFKKLDVFLSTNLIWKPYYI